MYGNEMGRSYNIDGIDEVNIQNSGKKLEGKGPLQRPSVDARIICIKMNLNEIV
jgi:hypothetical protein